MGENDVNIGEFRIGHDQVLPGPGEFQAYAVELSPALKASKVEECGWAIEDMDLVAR